MGVCMGGCRSGWCSLGSSYTSSAWCSLDRRWCHLLLLLLLLLWRWWSLGRLLLWLLWGLLLLLLRRRWWRQVIVWWTIARRSWARIARHRSVEMRSAVRAYLEGIQNCT